MITILVPNFAKRGGFVPIVVQDNASKDVLMLAYTDKECFLETIETGEAVYYSTSRNKRWKKGETSGAIQKVRHILIDCDGDALVYRVDQAGTGACHTGAWSCFFRTIGGNKAFAWPPSLKQERLELAEVELVKVGFLFVSQSTI